MDDRYANFAEDPVMQAYFSQLPTPIREQIRARKPQPATLIQTPGTMFVASRKWSIRRAFTAMSNASSVSSVPGHFASVCANLSSV